MTSFKCKYCNKYLESNSDAIKVHLESCDTYKKLEAAQKDIQSIFDILDNLADQNNDEEFHRLNNILKRMGED